MGVFAVDGEPGVPMAPHPQLPPQTDFGFRNDLQLRGISRARAASSSSGFSTSR